MYRVTEGCLPAHGSNDQCLVAEQSPFAGTGEHITSKLYDLEGTMAAFLNCPLNFDIKDIKVLCTDSDRPFQRQ